MKKPLMLAGLVTCTMLPLAASPAVSAYAAPKPSATVSMKISKSCVATVTGRWTNQLTAPVTPDVSVWDQTAGPSDSATQPTPSGGWKVTGSITVDFQLDTSATPHVIAGGFTGVSSLGDGGIETSGQSVNCAVPPPPS